LALQIEIQYYFFCILILISTAIGLAMTIIELRKINDKIFEMAYYEVELDVLRGGEMRKISSFDVVPGDLVFFGRNLRVPFEGVLLEGEMLINECALTGESVPVAKKSESLQKYINQEEISRNCFIFEGTTIVQINNKKKMNVL
jgi:cation-transporting ATPase 13A2